RLCRYPACADADQRVDVARPVQGLVEDRKKLLHHLELEPDLPLRDAREKPFGHRNEIGVPRQVAGNCKPIGGEEVARRLEIEGDALERIDCRHRDRLVPVLERSESNVGELLDVPDGPSLARRNGPPAGAERIRASESGYGRSPARVPKRQIQTRSTEEGRSDRLSGAASRERSRRVGSETRRLLALHTPTLPRDKERL